MMPIDVSDIVIGAPAPTPFPGPPKSAQSTLDAIAALTRALEAGGYGAAPGASQVGSALKVEDLDATMKVLTFDAKHIKLAKKVEGAIFSGRHAKITFAGKEIKGFDGEYRYDHFAGPTKFVIHRTSARDIIPIVTDEPQRHDDVVDAYSYGVKAFSSFDEAVDDRVIVTDGSVLTEAAIRDAARWALEAQDRIVMNKLVLSPTQFKNYQELMQRPTDVFMPVGDIMAMWFPPSYMNPRCTKCNKQTQNCTCVGDAEETPDLAKAKKLAADIDFKMVKSFSFKMVKSFSERAEEGKKSLDGLGREGGCYMCAHPKKVSYAHRVHKMRFCLDCCALLASE